MKGAMRKNILIWGLMVLLSLGIYGNSLNNAFHYDDEHHIVYNPNLKDLRKIPSFFTDPGTFSGVAEQRTLGHFRPLLLTTFALNYAAGGLNPLGYHLVNLFFHTGSAFLVFLIILILLADYKIRYFAALSSSIIFLIHPFNTEVVNYITARSSVMCTFFYLLTFYCWIKYREPMSQLVGSSLPPCGGGSGWGGVSAYRYYIALLSFLLALLTKEIAITLPIVLWLYDLYFTGSRAPGFKGSRFFNWQSCLPYIPLAIVSVSYLTLRRLLLGSVYTEGLPYGENLLNQIRVLREFLVMLVWPRSLGIDHPFEKVSTFLSVEVMGSLVIIVILVAAGFYLLRKTEPPWRVISFFILWYFITLLPTTVIPVIHIAILQENRGYLAVVGIIAVFGVLLSLARLWVQRVAVYVLIVLIFVFGILTIRQNTYWENDLTLWSDAVRKNPDSVRAHSNLGRSYLREKQYEKAEEELIHALNLESQFAFVDYLHIRYDLAEVYHRMGKYPQAVENLREAIHVDPENAYLYVKMGNIYVTAKDWHRAEKAYQKALEIRPGNTEALARLGVIYAFQERYPEAVPYLRQAAQDLSYPRREEILSFLAFSLKKAELYDGTEAGRK